MQSMFLLFFLSFFLQKFPGKIQPARSKCRFTKWDCEKTIESNDTAFEQPSIDFQVNWLISYMYIFTHSFFKIQKKIIYTSGLQSVRTLCCSFVNLIQGEEKVPMKVVRFPPPKPNPDFNPNPNPNSKSKFNCNLNTQIKGGVASHIGLPSLRFLFHQRALEGRTKLKRRWWEKKKVQINNYCYKNNLLECSIVMNGCQFRDIEQGDLLLKTLLQKTLDWQPKSEIILQYRLCTYWKSHRNNGQDY